MVRKKRKGRRWRKDWHHRVPDFKLVDCTPKPLKYRKIKKEVKVSIADEK